MKTGTNFAVDEHVVKELVKFSTLLRKESITDKLTYVSKACEHLGSKGISIADTTRLNPKEKKLYAKIQLSHFLIKSTSERP